jgi:hypothetical protein
VVKEESVQIQLKMGKIKESDGFTSSNLKLVWSMVEEGVEGIPFTAHPHIVIKGGQLFRNNPTRRADTGSVPGQDPHRFWKLDPDPHQSRKIDPDPRPHQSEQQNPGPHQSQRMEALEVHFLSIGRSKSGKK